MLRARLRHPEPRGGFLLPLPGAVVLLCGVPAVRTARTCVYLQALGLRHMRPWYCQDSRRTGLRQAPVCQSTCRAQECALHGSSPTDRWPSFCLHHHSAEKNKALPLSPRITNLVEDLGQNRLRREDQGRAGEMLRPKRETSSYLKANKSWEDMEEEGRASWSRVGVIQLSMANLLWWPHSDGRELWLPHACPALGGDVLCTLETV